MVEVEVCGWVGTYLCSGAVAGVGADVASEVGLCFFVPVRRCGGMKPSGILWACPAVLAGDEEVGALVRGCRGM